jgi:hypothetical protein
MCGIFGFVDLTAPLPPGSRVLLRRMGDALHHRGPDDRGFYQSGQAALGVTRLSIVDPERGRQPASNENGTVQVLLNGEIYNSPELRRDLSAAGHRFRSRSDTETVAHLYEERSDEAVRSLRGMFAIAVWDQNRRRLTLIRDRLGEKPLFYAQVGGRLIFASEIKALLFHPGLDRDLVSSWWATETESYFDFHHAEGGFPNEGRVQQGKKADLFEWVMKGLKKRGLEGKRIAADKDLSRRQIETVNKVFTKETKFDSIEDDCERMRMIKTPEELALWRRAYRVFDEAHAFARDLLLEKGTDLTDYELGRAAEEFGTNLLMKGIKRDGAPHTAVGIQLGVGVRAGRSTAYPHPNQFFMTRIQRGHSIQFSGVMVRIGGYGGAAQDPEWFTTAPAKAIDTTNAKLGFKNGDIDLYEINEAFAVVTMVMSIPCCRLILSRSISGKMVCSAIPNE